VALRLHDELLKAGRDGIVQILLSSSGRKTVGHSGLISSAVAACLKGSDSY